MNRVKNYFCWWASFLKPGRVVGPRWNIAEGTRARDTKAMAAGIKKPARRGRRAHYVQSHFAIYTIL
jgi:hypothetical protein